MSVNNPFLQDRKQAEQQSTILATQNSKINSKADFKADSKTPGDSPPSYGAETPDITAAFSNLSLDTPQGKPTVDECIAHLKLLEAFSQLREDIGTTDALYGIQDDFASCLRAERRTESLARMREKRWAVFVTRAVDRFAVYWQNCIEPDARMLRQTDVDSSLFGDGFGSSALKFDVDNLPPLDIVLVWHAYMLNPRSFFADCIRAGKNKFWAAGLPWKAINASIDNGTFEYNPSEEARQRFESQTGRAWNNRDDPPFAKLSCPKCRREVTPAWTTCESPESWTVDKPGETGAGYADPDFIVRCNHCLLVINHDILRTQKFRSDMQLLLLKTCPMPGTFLTLQGLPTSPKASHSVSFPNRLIAAGLNTQILEATDMKRVGLASMGDIRFIIEAGLKDPEILAKAARPSRFTRPQKDERIAIRRMMSSYWGNSSPFALDLVGAVIRQSSFIEKMHNIDWIHSPAVTSTMSRLITKYERYFEILSRYPKQVAVPTLDVDLAWHTHQLSPTSYFTYSCTKTAIFVDHDDKIEENKLSRAFEWTSKTYQRLFDSVYSECTCWYCEAIRESHTSSISRIFKSSNDPVVNELDRLHDSSAKLCDPEKTAHISAHNSIKDNTDPVKSKVRLAEIERNYQKACQRARKRGREPPTRDTSYTYWGYPMIMPFYAPYMYAYPVGGMYVANPACANFESGGMGNCCQGACGGGVAAGGCAQGACGGGGVGGSCGGGGDGGGGGCGGGG